LDAYAPGGPPDQTTPSFAIIAPMKETNMTMSTEMVSRQIEINGASLFVEDRGHGDPLVLVQPGLMSSAPFAELASLLSEQFRVITFDNRGHGRSMGSTEGMSYELLADDTAALISALELDRPFVGGWSDGGEVALQFGLRHTGRARALIAGATSLELGTEKTREDIRGFFHVSESGAVDFDAFAGTMKDSLLPMMQGLHSQTGEQWKTILQQSANMMLSYAGLTREQLEQIKEPVLILAGDRDDFVPVEEAIRLYRGLSDAELAILPGASHMRPIFDPATTARAIVDFLQRH
jgi:pimeloyl-ACP methyl ester carboxylesterase